MTLSKKKRQIFIVRIWLEPSELKHTLPTWRGIIEVVDGNQQRHIKRLEDIITFIAPYLDEMGVQSARRWPLKGRLPWWK